MTIANDINWPRKDDRLVASGPDFQNNACIEQYYPGTVTSRRRGFSRAVEIIFEKLSVSNFDLDVLIYPVLFLCRHDLELALKEIIQDTILIQGLRGFPPTNHKLVDLWGKVKGFMGSRWVDDDMKNAAALFDALINELENIDPSATAFRYAFDRNGETNLKGITHINARNLCEVVERMQFFLGACKWVTGYEVDRMSEAYHEY